MKDSFWTRVKREWWFHVSRKFDAEYLARTIAFRLPQRVQYWAFIRVCARVEPSTPGFMDMYVLIAQTWEDEHRPKNVERKAKLV